MEINYNRWNNPDYSQAQESSKRWMAVLILSETVDLSTATGEILTGHVIAGGVTAAVGTAIIGGIGWWADRRINRLIDNADELNRQNMVDMGGRIEAKTSPSDKN